MNDEMYQLDKEDYDTVNDTADWFLGTLKPRTASEIRGILIKMYLTGMAKGIRMAAETIQESD